MSNTNKQQCASQRYSVVTKLRMFFNSLRPRVLDTNRGILILTRRYDQIDSNDLRQAFMDLGFKKIIIIPVYELPLPMEFIEIILPPKVSIKTIRKDYSEKKI